MFRFGQGNGIRRIEYKELQISLTISKVLRGILSCREGNPGQKNSKYHINFFLVFIEMFLSFHDFCIKSPEF